MTQNKLSVNGVNFEKEKKLENLVSSIRVFTIRPKRQKQYAITLNCLQIIISKTGNKMYLLRIQSKEVDFKLEYEIHRDFSIKWEEEKSFSTYSIMSKSDSNFNRFVSEKTYRVNMICKVKK